MKITVFAKECKKRDGGTFYRYIGKLTRKSTGEVVTVSVNFRQECGAPNPHNCPRIVEFDKKNANYSESDFTKEDGTTIKTRELWISKWKDGGEFVDNSLDDFD